MAGLPGAMGADPGKPLRGKIPELRSAMLRAVSAADVRAVGQSLVDQAKAGDTAAAKVLLDRVLGKPPRETVEIEQRESVSAFWEECQRKLKEGRTKTIDVDPVEQRSRAGRQQIDAGQPAAIATRPCLCPSM